MSWLKKLFGKKKESTTINIYCDSPEKGLNDLNKSLGFEKPIIFKGKEILKSKNLTDTEKKVISKLITEYSLFDNCYSNEIDCLGRFLAYSHLKVEDNEAFFCIANLILKSNNTYEKHLVYETILSFYNKNKESYPDYKEKIEYWSLEELKQLPKFVASQNLKNDIIYSYAIQRLSIFYSKDYPKLAEVCRIALILNLSDNTVGGYLKKLDKAKSFCGEELVDLNIGYTSKTLPKLMESIYEKLRNPYSYTKLKILPDTYVCIDIETTGLSYDSDEIIELGAVLYKNGIETDRFASLVKPKHFIPAHITAINGISENMVKNAPSIEQVLPQYIQYINRKSLCGHNVNFDIRFILYNAEKLGLIVDDMEALDTLPLVRKVLPDLPDHKLTTLKDYLNIETESHRAVADCETTHCVYEFCKSKKY